MPLVLRLSVVAIRLALKLTLAPASGVMVFIPSRPLCPIELTVDEVLATSVVGAAGERERATGEG